MFNLCKQLQVEDISMQLGLCKKNFYEITGAKRLSFCSVCKVPGPGSLFGTGQIRNGLFLNGYNSDQGNFGTVVIPIRENSANTVCNNE